jgi:hypothetical protein
MHEVAHRARDQGRRVERRDVRGVVDVGRPAVGGIAGLAYQSGQQLAVRDGVESVRRSWQPDRVEDAVGQDAAELLAGDLFDDQPQEQYVELGVECAAARR